MSLGSVAAPRGAGVKLSTQPFSFASPATLASVSQALLSPSQNVYQAPNYSGILGAAAKPTSVAPTVQKPVAAPTAQGGTDYSKQLADDQILQQQIAGVNAQGTGNAANLAAQRQRALIQYGQIPDNLSGQLTGNVNGDIDQVTRDLAGQSTQGGTSTVAQLQKAYQNQQQADLANLAARGMIHSGALGQHTQDDLTAYQQSQSSAQQQLLDALTSYYQNYLGLQSQGQASITDATNQALQRIIAQINASVPATNGGGGGGGAGDVGAAPPPPELSTPAAVSAAQQATQAAGNTAGDIYQALGGMFGGGANQAAPAKKTSQKQLAAYASIPGLQR